MNKLMPVKPESSEKHVANSDANEIMEKVLLAGDLSKMDPKDRINYYLETCRSLGMNPLTKPFDLITLNGKMVLYPNRSGGDQLRKIYNVDTIITDKKFDKDTGCYIVTAQGKLPNGRMDEDMGIVYCATLKGEALANAQLKAVTKAKRRVALSLIGLGWIDESEVSSVKGTLHKMDLDTGEVIDLGPTKTAPPKKDPEDFDPNNPVDQASVVMDMEPELKPEPKYPKDYRQKLLKRALALYPKHPRWNEVFPGKKWSDVATEYFKDPAKSDTRSLSLREFEAILNFIENEFEGRKTERIVPPAKWFNSPHPGLDNDERYVK